MATKGKMKAARATSNVFAMFEQSQVQEFKEVRIDTPFVAFCFRPPHGPFAIAAATHP